MPKENINDCIDGRWRLEVTWQNGDAAWVQVASVNPDSPVKLAGDTPNDPMEPFDGWRVTVNRDGINRIIRSLRKARDQAFGRDE